MRSPTRPDGRPDTNGPATTAFTRFAAVYDDVYDARGKDYAAEADAVIDLVRASDGPATPRSVLDLACGTGRHLARFAERLGPGCDLAGLDACPAMLARARARSRPDGAAVAVWHEGDLRRADLGRRFDLVTCLFGSPSYVDPDGRDTAIATMARHLAPGGRLVLEPAVFVERLAPPRRSVTTVRRTDGTRVERADDAEIVRRTDDAAELHIRFAFRVETPDGAVERFDETHVVHLETEAAFDARLRGHGLVGRGVRGPLRVYAAAPPGG